MDDIPEQDYNDLIPCHICGRSFREDVLTRHQIVCEKSSKKQRKIFDSRKQRIEGTDIPVKVLKTLSNPVQKPAQKNSNWRNQHEEFIKAIRNAKQYQNAVARGTTPPPPLPPTIDPSLIQCPHCSRRFNEKAAERHISFCREQKQRLAGPGTQSTLKQGSGAVESRLKTRTQYQPPRPKVAAPISSAGTNRSALPSGLGQGNASLGSRSMASPSAGGGPALRTGKTQQGYAQARAELMRVNNGGSASSSSSSAGRQPIPVQNPMRRGSNGFGNSNYSKEARDLSGNAAGGGIRNGNVGGGAGGASRFCHDCGTKYPVSHAKFCCECGVRRVSIL